MKPVFCVPSFYLIYTERAWNLVFDKFRCNYLGAFKNDVVLRNFSAFKNSLEKIIQTLNFLYELLPQLNYKVSFDNFLTRIRMEAVTTNKSNYKNSFF